jgi:kynurenine formamidase
MVKSARIFDLSHTWDERSPIAGVNPPYSMTLNATHENTRGTFGDGGQLSFTSEIQQWSGQHGAPSIDAIGHIGHNGLLFGGVDAATATSDPRGIGRGRKGVGAQLDIAHYPKELLVNRAVLLDVARFINRNSRPLAGAFNITADILADTARHQGVEMLRGDTVLIRTGWGRYFADKPDLYKGDNAAGVGVTGAHFLIERGARVVGNDTLTFEVRPPIAFPPETPLFQVFPVHMLLIADNGINIIENYFLDEIAAAKEYEFLLVVGPRH